MSKIRELIEEKFISLLAVYDPQKEMDVGDFFDYTNEVSKEVEQAIKAEIMGLDRYDPDRCGMEKAEYGEYIDIDDLESLFKESE